MTTKKTHFRSEQINFLYLGMKFKIFSVSRAEYIHMFWSMNGRKTNLHFAEYLNLKTEIKG